MGFRVIKSISIHTRHNKRINIRARTCGGAMTMTRVSVADGKPCVCRYARVRGAEHQWPSEDINARSRRIQLIFFALNRYDIIREES